MNTEKDKKTEEKKSLWKKYALLWRTHPFQAVFRLLFLLCIFLTAGLAGIYHTYREEIQTAFSLWVGNQTHYLFAPKTTFSKMETISLGHFIFHNFRVEDPYRKNVNCIDAVRIEVELIPLYLFWRGITISRVEIDHGKFYFHKENGNGDINFSDLFKKSGQGQGHKLRLRVKKFLLNDCRATLEDLEAKPIENRIYFMEGSFTRIAGENLVEVFSSRINTSYWSVGDIQLSGIFIIGGDYLKFRNTRVVKGETDLIGEGFVDFSRETFEYRVKPGTLDLQHLPRELGMRQYLQGTAKISAIFLGRFDSTAVEAKISLSQGVVFDYPVRDFSADLHYTAHRLKFENIQTEAWGGKVRSDVIFLFGKAGEGYFIKGEAENIRPQELKIPRLGKTSGILSGHLDLQARGYNLRDLFLSGTISSLHGKLYGIPFDSSRASFHYKDSNTRIDNLTVSSGSSLATAIGDIQGQKLFLFVMVEKLPVSRLGSLLPFQGLEGILDFSGLLSGELMDPQLKGTFIMSPGSWHDLSFKKLEGSCSLRPLVENPAGTVELVLSNIEFSGRDFDSLKISASIPDSGMTRFSQVVLVEDSLSRLKASGYYLNEPESGRQRIIADSLDILYHGERAFITGITELYFRGDTIAIPSFRLGLLSGFMEGSLVFPGNRRIAADLSFDRIDLSRLPRILEQDLAIKGNLSGRLHMEGSREDPVGELEARIDDALVFVLNSPQVKVQARLEGGELRIDRLELSDTSLTASIKGTIPFRYLAEGGFFKLDRDKKISLEAKFSHFPIYSVKSDIIPLKSGWLDGGLVIGGAASKPVISGETAISGGEGLIGPINMRLKNMTGKISFQPGIILLSDFRSTSPEGDLDISGRIPLTGFEPDSLDLKIYGQNLILQQFKYVTSLKMNADLSLQGPINKPVLSGAFRVLGGEINPSLGSIQVAGSDQPATSEAVIQLPISPVDYNLTFVAPENFWLRNRNATIKLTARLRAVQQEGTPQVTGEITTVAGFFTLYGRRFRIRYGSIQFQGKSNLDPLLDINSERTVRGKIMSSNFFGPGIGFRGAAGPTVPGEQYEVDRNTFYLHIGGTLSSPQFEITVKDRDNRDIEPPLTEEQARTLVIFDQTFSEFQQQTSLSQSKLLDQAANMALNQANPYLQGLTGLDEFSFESQLFNRGANEEQTGERASAKITMGEFLFESVFFSFSQDLIDPTAQSAQIEYLISRNSSIVSQSDSRGHFSVDFRFRIKY